MKRFFFAAVVVSAGFGISAAQTEGFDIATFTPPAGWKRTDAAGSVSYMAASGTGAGASTCQIVLYPSGPSKGDAKKDFEAAWANIVAAGMGSDAKPVTSSEKRPDGWEMHSGAANLTFQGVGLATVVTTASGFGRAMSIQATVAGGGQGCIPVIKAFVDSLKFNVSGPGVAASPSQAAAAMPASFSYDYVAPEGWSTRRMEGHIRLEAPGGSCLILIFPPQRSSGDLQRDAAAVFDQMYPGWQPQKAGEQRYTFSKGVLPGGQEFFMMEAGMKKPSADGTRYDGFEDGAALVVKAGDQFALVVARHNTALIGHDGCYKRYIGWRRFFNSFAVRGGPAAGKEDPARRLIGRWSMAESGGTGEYVFAANGNYALVGAIGSTSTSSDIRYDYLHITTYAFPGDGAYKVAGDQLTFHRRGGAPEPARIRFDQVNHGGAGWIDRIHVLKRDAQGESESTYERRGK